MELDFSKNTYFFHKKSKKQFFAKNAFLAQNSALVWKKKKKKQIVFKKITSKLFLQISKQTSCENPIQIHQEMVYLCYFEDDNVLKWEKKMVNHLTKCWRHFGRPGADPRMVRIGTGPPFWQINHANSVYFRLFLGHFRGYISHPAPPFGSRPLLFTYPGSGLEDVYVTETIVWY